MASPAQHPLQRLLILCRMHHGGPYHGESVIARDKFRQLCEKDTGCYRGVRYCIVKMFIPGSNSRKRSGMLQCHGGFQTEQILEDDLCINETIILKTRRRCGVLPFKGKPQDFNVGKDGMTADEIGILQERCNVTDSLAFRDPAGCQEPVGESGHTGNIRGEPHTVRELYIGGILVQFLPGTIAKL